MGATRYQVVFRGEVGIGYDHAEIRENLARLTHWDASKIDQLLASNHCIIKTNLELAAADRMVSALNNTGILCQRERVPEAVPSAPQPSASDTIAVVGRPAIAVEGANAQNCPKCGHLQDGGLSCPACGIIFAKFGQPRSGANNSTVAAPKVVSSHAAALQRSAKRRENPLSKLEESHPFGYYLGKFLLVIAVALLLRSLYKADLTILILCLLPLGFALYLGALSAVTERPFSELFVEHRSLLPLPFRNREEQGRSLPFATYGLVALHALLYLGFQLRTPVVILEEKWFFLPQDGSTAHMVLSAFASLFFHGSAAAFFGGLLFLWIIGATVERRIGSGFVIALYLLCGLIAAGVGLGVQQLLPGDPLQIIGAGGGIAGLLGVFLLCSHRRSMLFPLPFFGIDTLVTGSPYQVRWSSLFVAALFVFVDLSAPVAAAEAGSGALGLTILLGGLLSGLLATYALGLGNAAGDEEEESMSGSQVFTANEEGLRRRLEANPDNPDLQLQLARVIAGEGLTDEARELYRRAILGRLASKPKEAAEIYREFNLRHQEVFEPKLTLRLASLYQRQGDLAMTASVLHSLYEDERATPQEREKALYQYCVTIAKLGQIDEAHMMLTRFSNDFPESALLTKLRALIYDAAQSGPE